MSEDTISRQTAIDAIWEHATKILEGSDYDLFIQEFYKMAHRHIAEVIERLPSAQTEITEQQIAEYCRKRNLVLITQESYEMLKAYYDKQNSI